MRFNKKEIVELRDLVNSLSTSKQQKKDTKVIIYSNDNVIYGDFDELIEKI